MKKIALILLCLPQLMMGQRNEYNINKDWYFTPKDVVGANHPDCDITAWKSIDLPYDYSMEAGYSPVNTPQNSWLPAGNCWFRKNITHKMSSSERTYIWFDGAYMDSEVYVNGRLAGNRPYGFISFYYDITDLLHEGDNSLCVRIKNEKAPTARFYHGSSIYGNVKLIKVPEMHIPVSGGVFYQVEKCDEGTASIAIQTEILNKSDSNKKVVVFHALYDSSGNEVAQCVTGTEQVYTQSCRTIEAKLQVQKPQLWDLNTPHLYRLKTTLLVNGKKTDSVSTSVGIRNIEFRNDTGFYLNGRNIKLQGMCEHMEMLPVGQAIPDDLWRKRISLLKSMGCNTIRTSHNPFPPIFYQLCDEIGMMVVDEIFDGWKKKGANDYGGRYFAEWWKKDVEDWVRRDRNHPSIIMWSIGNETGTSDIHRITEEIHKYDKQTRPTSGGNVLWGTDVAGFTGQGGMPGALEKFHEENPERPIVLMEVPHTIQTRGFYRVPTWWRDKGGAVNEIEPYGTRQIFFDGHPRYRSSYDNCAVRINARTCWKRTKKSPWIIGEFRWTGYECFGEAQFMGIEYPKRSYNAGIIDFAGFPKDHFYFYQSQWTEKPMVYLLPHWTHPELEKGTEVPVVAYSNCDEVELFLNGHSLGKKPASELLDFVWKVPYEAGEIKAVGYKNKKRCATASHKTASFPVSLSMEVDSPMGAIVDEKVSYVSVSSKDKKGNMVPWTCNKVKFKVDGDVKVLGFENGNPIDGTHNKVHERTLFYGLARGFFQNVSSQGDIRVIAGSILGDTLFNDNTMVAIDVKSVMLRGNGRKEKFEIYYTTDGSIPTKRARCYSKPFELNSSTLVKAVAYSDGKEVLSLEERFTQGSQEKYVDPMLRTDEVLKNNFAGPFDKEIVGKWVEENTKTTYFFDAKGNLFQFVGDGYFPKLLGKWWYDYPNDKFENPDSVGSGEVKWEQDSTVVSFSLGKENDDLLIIECQEPKILKRVK